MLSVLANFTAGMLKSWILFFIVLPHTTIIDDNLAVLGKQQIEFSLLYCSVQLERRSNIILIYNVHSYIHSGFSGSATGNDSPSLLRN